MWVGMAGGGGPCIREVTAANCCTSISESNVTPHYWKQKKGEVICLRPSLTRSQQRHESPLVTLTWHGSKYTSVAGQLCKLARVTGPEFPPPLLSSWTLPASDWPVPRGAV